MSVFFLFSFLSLSKKKIKICGYIITREACLHVFTIETNALKASVEVTSCTLSPLIDLIHRGTSQLSFSVFNFFFY